MRILVPTDGSTYSENAARVAANIARKHEHEMIVLHVVDDKGFKRKKWRKDGAEHLIEQIEVVLVENGCRKECIEGIIRDGNASEEIAEVARERKVDRIVIGTQGKTGLKMILGSVTEKVLQISDALVLVVPPNYNQ